MGVNDPQEVSQHLSLSACLRGRLVNKAFSKALGYTVREMTYQVRDGSTASQVLSDVSQGQAAFPTAEGIMLVLGSKAGDYASLPELQVNSTHTVLMLMFRDSVSRMAPRNRSRQ
jgi:hypothetical protein